MTMLLSIMGQAVDKSRVHLPSPASYGAASLRDWGEAKVTKVPVVSVPLPMNGVAEGGAQDGILAYFN